MQENLPIPLRDEHVAETRELGSQLEIVIDLAVEDDVSRSEMKRLHRPLVEIDDRETSERQAGLIVRPRPLPIRSRGAP